MSQLRTSVPAPPCLLVLVLAVSFVPSAQAQPADNCAGSPEVGPVTLPFDGTPLNGTDDIDMSSCSGESGNEDDVVTCFTPQNSCSINVTCTGNGNNRIGIASGMCSGAPSCGTTAGPSASSVSISGFAVTGGTQYCIYCQVSGMSAIDTDITAASGDCGLLPVELVSFSVESSAPEGPPAAEEAAKTGGHRD